MSFKSKLAKKRFRGRALKTESTEAKAGSHEDPFFVRGHILYPSARILVKRYVRHARRTGMIRDHHEYELGIKALSAAAMTEAEKEGAKYVTPKHVATGWSRRLSVGGGNCPPHRCLRSSVINRVEELKESLPYFSELTSRKK